MRTLAAVRRRSLVATLLTLVAPAALAAQAPYSSLTFFGDSYVDTGNLALLTGGLQPSSPPYFPGHFSNGPVFTEYLAQGLGRPGDAAPAFIARAASGNYAIGGARTNGSIPPGTATQVGSYLTRPGATPTTVTDPTGLYVLFAGGNDLRDAGSLTDPAARQAAAAAAAQRVITQAGQLGVAGARNVLLFTLPSLSVTPEARGIPGRPAIDDALAAAFNGTLAAGIAGLQASLPGATVFNFRLDNLYANILADAASGGALYGLTNLTTPCLAPGAPSCDVSVFADDLHPTTRMHQFIGSAVATYVTTGRNVALVPEPATFVLVGIGAAALAGHAVRRRRAA